MRLPKLNTVVLALIFSLLIEGINTGVYYWLATSFSPDTFVGKLCDLDLFLHRPAAGLTQMFYPTSQWPGVGAHILFYIFDFIEWWILMFAVIWTIRRFYQRFDDKRPAA